MKRLLQTYAPAMLLAAGGAHARADTAAAPRGAPPAPGPPPRARPARPQPTEPAPAARPDRTWRDANATVGGRNAMRLTMPAMNGGQAAPAAPMHEHAHHPGMDMGATQGGEHQGHDGHKEMK